MRWKYNAQFQNIDANKTQTHCIYIQYDINNMKINTHEMQMSICKCVQQIKSKYMSLKLNANISLVLILCDAKTTFEKCASKTTNN